MNSVAVRAFYAALDAVLPTSLVHSRLSRKGDLLHVGNELVKLSKNVYVVGFGKAVSGMCRAVQNVVGEHIVKGILSVPAGSRDVLARTGRWSLLPIDDGCVHMREGAANNLPDDDSVVTTEKILDMVSNLTENDIVIALISGGGSALLCAPLQPISLKDKLWVTETLAKQGSTITELNIIRKKMSKVKGGGLAKAAFPAKVVSLILSDIIGDPVDMIASGPTVPNNSSALDCSSILEKYSMLGKLPKSVSSTIFQNKTQPDSRCWDNVHNIIVGSNSDAVSAAVKYLEESGYQTLVLSRGITGEARDVGDFLIKFGIAIAKQMEAPCKVAFDKLMDDSKQWSWMTDLPLYFEELCNCQKIGIIGAGETTVTVTGDGKGGRNQELSLAASISLFKSFSQIPSEMTLSLLSAGTDGQDGPTDATGAVFDNKDLQIVNSAKQLRKAQDALMNNDSYGYLSKFPENILKTGLTGTNVMDLQIMTIENRHT